MNTQNSILRHTILDISKNILDYAFKCDKISDYFELGYYEKCKETIEEVLLMNITKMYKNYILKALFGYSCYGGYIQIVKLTIICKEFVKEMPDYTLYKGLNEACRGGHVNIAKLIIEKGANDFRIALGEACVGGNIEITNILGSLDCMEPVREGI